MKAASPPSIRLDGVSKWYGSVLALNEVSAEFGPGVWGLLGPNGAGKSTLMRLATGLVGPSLGTVRLCGRDPRQGGSVLGRLGFCPETDAVYPGVPVLEVAAYLARLSGVPRPEARDRARRALERVGLADVLGRGVNTFSKGMRQRAKLALAIAHDPDVLVLDEPLNGLDPPGRRELGDVIRALGEEGRCVLASSHILHEIETLTDQVLLLHVGRVRAEGRVAEIRREIPERPLTVRVTTSAPAVLARRIVDVEGVQRVEIGSGSLAVLTRCPERFFDRVAAVVEEGVEVRAIEPLDEDLEAVFRYLTR